MIEVPVPIARVPMGFAMAGVRLGWLCAPRQMIPAFQGFLFGGGVNPYVSPRRGRG
jgi:hypothetical protein